MLKPRNTPDVRGVSRRFTMFVIPVSSTVRSGFARVGLYESSVNVLLFGRLHAISCGVAAGFR